MGFLKKIFGSHSDHELKRLYPIADKIEAMSDEYAALTDEQLRAKTDEFKQRYADGESLDDLLPEAFATAREAAWRVLGMKPFRVQLIGGIVLHQGRIAEMKTGEGVPHALKMVVHFTAAAHDVADVLILIAIAGAAGDGVFFQNVDMLTLHLAVTH